MTQHPASRKSDRSPLQLNLTSMIDVVFLMLVYFVLTAAFTDAEGVITANMPNGPEHPQPLPKIEQPIRVTVSARGEAGYYLAIDKLPTTPMSFADLTHMLQGLRDSDRNGFFTADNLVIIDSDRSVRWQHTLNAYNAALGAGYSNIAFAQTP
ncbi:MAG: biopolymer transporter ExbD [Phycisphaeraceae bacterium]